MRLIVTTTQFDLLLKQQKPKYPLNFDYKVAPVVLNILKKYHPSEVSK